MPYTRQGKGGGYNGEIVEYRSGADPVCIPIDAEGDPVIDMTALRRVAESLDTAIEELDAGMVQRAALQLKRARQSLHEQLPPDIPPLPSFEIESHQLPEENNGQ